MNRLIMCKHIFHAIMYGLQTKRHKFDIEITTAFLDKQTQDYQLASTFWSKKNQSG